MKNALKKYGTVSLFLLAAVITVIIALLFARMSARSADMIEETTARELLSESKTVALLATADELDNFLDIDDMETEEYQLLKQQLAEFCRGTNIIYAYYMRLDTETNMMQFIIDNAPGMETGLVEPQVDREDCADLALSGVANAVPHGTYSEGWEGYATAFAPVYYADGSPSNIIAGVDIMDTYVQQVNRDAYTYTAALTISLISVLGICLACIYLYNQKATQAEAASISKSTFLSNMSHEMRTPMNAIIGMTEIAKTSHEQDRVQYCLAKIGEAAEHLLGVINDILDISKIEAGKFQFSSSEFLLENLLKRVSTVVNFKVDEKKQSFIISVDSNVPEYIVADQQRLAQVITNLLSNAIKFTPDEGMISLYVHLEDESSSDITLRFDVVDTGIGIDPESQKNLFRSFQQADNSISRQFGGTGLGLAISKNIVTQMGGEIEVISAPDAGSTFTFTVKVGRGKFPDSNLSINTREGAENPKLLVVDCSSEVLGYFCRIADKLGLQCSTASSGQDALDLIDSGNEYDVIFVGFKMPGMDGITFTDTLRRTHPIYPPVVMMTGTQWSSIEDKALRSGVSHYLLKPFFPSTVADCINNCIAESSHEAISEDFNPEFPNYDGIFSGKRVLLTEDMEINREIIVAMLSETGIAIDAAENGRVAIDMFSARPDSYDLILMDIHMPEIDGYQATRAIRALPAENAARVPIIALTANVFKEDIDRCIDSGMNDHIGKPVDFDTAIEKIKKYIL